MCASTWLENGSDAILATKRSAGVTSEVNLRNPFHTDNESTQARDPPWLSTQDRRHQKSKTGVSVAHKQDWCPPKKIQPFFFQNRRSITNLFCTRGQWAGTACACSGSFELDCRVSWRRFRTSLFRNTSPSSLRWRRHSSRDGRWWTGSRSSPSVRV